jgi:hypothetical protein
VHPQGTSSGEDAGFLAADALVGLLVVALGLVAVLQAQALVARMAAAAHESRRALAEAELRLETEWPQLGQPGERSGSSEDRSMKWVLTARSLGVVTGSPLSICDIDVFAQMNSSHRKTHVRTQRLCHSADEDG